MKSLAQQVNENMVVESSMTGEEYAEYWDGIGDAIEALKWNELKKYFPGMPNYTGDAKKLIMAGVAHVGAWVRGASASAADDDPEGYDYDDYVESVFTSRDPDEWRMITDDMWNNDDYEKYAKKMTRDGDSDGAQIVRWFEGEFCPVFFANWYEKNESAGGSVANINEARQIEYYVAFLGTKDVNNDDLPYTATILVDKANQKDFERFLEAEEGNIFEHAEGGNVEY